ncbi:MAG: type II secretion system secretin GspD [Nitrospinae bacterium]|nr:type II secretion system secretin GspD [Nitrospinota bacterium]
MKKKRAARATAFITALAFHLSTIAGGPAFAQPVPPEAGGPEAAQGAPQPAPGGQSMPPVVDQPRLMKGEQPMPMGAPAPAPAQGFSPKVDMSLRVEPLKPGEKINIDFNDADLKMVVKFIAELTGKNFVIDEKVKGKVTIISPQMVSAPEALRLLESTLEVYGYSIIEAGRVMKVVPAAEARQRGGFRPGAEMGDRMITRLIPLQHVKADELVNVLRPLVPTYSFINAFAGTNTIIVVDYASNIEKLLAIINQLDSPTNEESVTVVQLQFAGAKEMSEKLEKIFKGKGARTTSGSATAPTPSAPTGSPPGTGGWTGSDVQIIPDERINSLVIVATKGQTDQIVELVERLDIKPPVGRGGINVRYLKNADAESVAKVLNNLTSSQATAQQQAQAKGGSPAGAIKLQDKVTITPDKATNSLVITASVEDYETLDQVIEKLDVRRKQVFVEALIMEVTSDKSQEFGIEWRTTSNFTESGVQGFGGVNYGNINAVAQNPLNSPQGLAVGVVDGIISFGGVDFLNIGALLHAMQSEQGINVLSTPNIMTTDNEEAEIIVARNVPFQTSQSQTTGGNVVTTFERKNVGITLKIKPQISESNDVRLTVYQEISSVLPVEDQIAKDIMTFTRSVKTTVVVRDTQNIVIGGLISDDLNDTEVKVPLFGDIPLLGWLFKSTKKQKVKTNLLVFLTPHIIGKAEDMDRITSEKAGKLSLAPEEVGDFGGAVKEKGKGQDIKPEPAKKSYLKKPSADKSAPEVNEVQPAPELKEEKPAAPVSEAPMPEIVPAPAPVLETAVAPAAPEVSAEPEPAAVSAPAPVDSAAPEPVPVVDTPAAEPSATPPAVEPLIAEPPMEPKPAEPVIQGDGTQN